jgi:hypothetical protein
MQKTPQRIQRQVRQAVFLPESTNCKGKSSRWSSRSKPLAYTGKQLKPPGVMLAPSKHCCEPSTRTTDKQCNLQRNMCVTLLNSLKS